MSAPTTKPTDQDVTAFLDAVVNPRRRADGHALRALMERVSGERAVMWGLTIVGFGSSPYTNTLGTNEWFDLGFSPRNQALTIYGLYNAWASVNPLFAELGAHTTGKSCVYVKRLEDLDLEVLERLIVEAWNARGSHSGG